MSTDFATTYQEQAAPRRSRSLRRSPRTLAVQLIGPLTILAGIVWAFAQPYRIAFLYPEGKAFWDWVAQPPLLVVLVGAVYALVLAPGLVADLQDRGPER